MADEEPRDARDVHRRCRQAALVVAIVTFVVFLPSLAAGFVFDDRQLIANNEYVHALEWLPRAFATHLWDVSPLAVSGDLNGAVETTRRYYRPLVTVSFLLTWALAGARPWVFHLGNVLAHAVTAGLATRAAIRWTGSLALGIVVGAIFALHPTRTENVTWVSGRMDILMLLFVLLTLRAFERTRGPLAFAGGIALLACAVLCKEPAIMTPILLLAQRRRRDSTRSSWLPFASTAALCAAYAVFRRFVFRPDGDAAHPFTPVNFVFTVGAYTHRAIAPWPPTMYYDRVPLDGLGHPEYAWPILALGAVAVLGGMAALVLAWRRSRTAFWLLVAGIAFMGPLLNVFFNGMKESAQDRFLYAPLLFVLAGLARLARAPLQRLFRRRVTMLIAGGAALTAIALIELRTPDYRDQDAFWAAEVAQHPDDPYALQMIGRSAASRGDLQGALTLFRRASAVDARPYQNARDHVEAHFEEAGLLGGVLPDGRQAELNALLDETWRTVDPSAVPPRAVVLGFVVGEPLPKSLVAELAENQTFYWDAALLATRTGDFARGEAIARTVHPSRTAAHPLNAVLTLARLGRLEQARALARQIREGSSFQASAQDFEALSARLDRAARMAKARDAGAANGERQVFEALRLAELGAFWSALRALGEAADAPDAAPLVLQLLVACRFDAAAQTFAARVDDGPQTVAKLHAELPEHVKAMQPVPGTLEDVLAAAKRTP